MELLCIHANERKKQILEFSDCPESLNLFLMKLGVKFSQIPSDWVLCTFTRGWKSYAANILTRGSHFFSFSHVLHNMERPL